MFSAELPTLLTPYLCVPSSLTITYSAVTHHPAPVSGEPAPVTSLELSTNLREVAQWPEEGPD